MTRKKVAEILDANVSFEVSEREIAYLPTHADDQAETERTPPRNLRERQGPVEKCQRDGEDKCAERTFHRLVRRKQCPVSTADELADEERGNVVKLSRQDNVEDQPQPAQFNMVVR